MRQRWTASSIQPPLPPHKKLIFLCLLIKNIPTTRRFQPQATRAWYANLTLLRRIYISNTLQASQTRRYCTLTECVCVCVHECGVHPVRWQQTAVNLRSHVHQRQEVISESFGWPCAAKANHSDMCACGWVHVCGTEDYMAAELGKIPAVDVDWTWLFTYFVCFRCSYTV